MTITKGIAAPAAPFVTVAAVEGWGKSTLAAHMPSPVFIDTDKGISGDEIRLISGPYGCQEMLAICEEFIKNPPTDVKTLVIDTMDKLIDEMAKDLCNINKWGSMEEKQYFKCWVEYREKYFTPLLNALKEITRKRGITVLVLAHVKARKFEKPNGEGAWDRWETTFLYKELCNDLRQASDLYVFGDFKDVVFEADKRSGEAKRHASGGGKRMAYCEHSGAYEAKCRSFITRADGSAFPKSCTIDEFKKCLLEAIAKLGSKTPVDAPVAPEQPTEPVAAEKPAEAVPAPSAPTPAPTKNADYEKLRDLMKSFGVDEELVLKYIPTTKTFGPNPPPLDQCNPVALRWLCTGIASKKLTNEFIKNKLAILNK